MSDSHTGKPDGSLLDKYAKRTAFIESAQAHPLDTPPGTNGRVGQSPVNSAAWEETEDVGLFGWYRGIRDRAIMLELRKKDGHVLAIGYGWIERAEFDPDQGILLHLPGRVVRIQGSGLNQEVRPHVRLFEGIVRHRVPWVQESDQHQHLRTAQASEAISIERIQWDD